MQTKDRYTEQGKWTPHADTRINFYYGASNNNYLDEINSFKFVNFFLKGVMYLRQKNSGTVCIFSSTYAALFRTLKLKKQNDDFAIWCFIMCNVSRVNHYVLFFAGECGALAVYETDLYGLNRVKGTTRELM